MNWKKRGLALMLAPGSGPEPDSLWKQDVRRHKKNRKKIRRKRCSRAVNSLPLTAARRMRSSRRRKNSRNRKNLPAQEGEQGNAGNPAC